MSNNGTPLIGRGIYTVSEASRLTGVPAACIRRWLRGYAYMVTAGRKVALPVVTHDYPEIDAELALSFLDLIEVRIVNALRARGFTWKVIRLAEQHARDVFDIDHPFATRRFRTDGLTIFADLRKAHGQRPLLELTQNQFTFRAFVEPHLKNLEFDSKDQVSLWRPMGPRRRVLLDPARSFGQPIVSEGVPTLILSRAVRREGDGRRRRQVVRGRAAGRPGRRRVRAAARRMRFFVDNCLPPRWAPALSALADPGEFEVVHLRTKFDKGIGDVDWIAQLSAEGDWTIVSGDVKITRSVHEREAWLKSGLTAFFLVKGWDFEFWEKTARIIRWWPMIVKQTRMIQPGAGFYVPVNFRNGQFEQVTLKRNS